MKKLILGTLLFAIMMTPSAYASISGEYLAHNTMEGEWNNFYDAGQTSQKSDEEHHSGNRSLKYSPGAIDNFQVMTNPADISGKEKVFYKMYIKNMPEDNSGNPLMTMYAYTGVEGNTTLHQHEMEFSGVDENGWEEYSALVEPESGTTNVQIYFQLNKSVSLEAPVYVDDVIIQTTPNHISFENAIVRNSSTLNLNKLRLTGYDTDNNTEILTNSADYTKWTVVSGNAIVDKYNNLLYTGDTSGDVTVCGNYLDITANAVISFEKDIAIELQQDNTVKITNNTNKDIQRAEVVTALYDDNGRLYNSTYKTVSVSTNDSVVVSADEIIKPYFIQNNKIKVFINANGAMKTFEIQR